MAPNTGTVTLGQLGRRSFWQNLHGGAIAHAAAHLVAAVGNVTSLHRTRLCFLSSFSRTAANVQTSMLALQKRANIW